MDDRRISYAEGTFSSAQSTDAADTDHTASSRREAQNGTPADGAPVEAAPKADADGTEPAGTKLAAADEDPSALDGVHKDGSNSEGTDGNVAIGTGRGDAANADDSKVSLAELEAEAVPCATEPDTAEPDETATEAPAVLSDDGQAGQTGPEAAQPRDAETPALSDAPIPPEAPIPSETPIEAADHDQPSSTPQSEPEGGRMTAAAAATAMTPIAASRSGTIADDPETRIDESRLSVALSMRRLPMSPRQFYTRQRANVVSLLGIIAAVGVAGWYYQYRHTTEPQVVEVRDRKPVRRADFIRPEAPTPVLFTAPLPKVDRRVLLSLGDLEYRLGGERYSRLLRVGKGDTFSEVLEKARVPADDARAAIAAMRAVYDPRKLRERQKINVLFGTVGDEQSRFVGLRFDTSFDKVVQVQRQSNGEFVSAEIKKELDVGFARADGTISTSLFQAGIEAGAPSRAIVSMIHLFSFAVDFQRDIRKGDGFEMLYRVHRDQNGKIVRTGEVAYASLTVRGTTHRLYRYNADKKGKAEYLNEKGEGNRKALMKTPIDGARLTSNFGMRRHPILGYSRMHTGTDFGAPTGTPIYAAGDGTVIMAGWRGGYGKYVRIRHNKEYMTAYAHMSKLHVKNGQRVKQGQVIGRVGSTGRSTGPHLHYEVLRNGKFINPATMTLPSRNRLKGNELARFLVTKRKLDALFAALRKNDSAGKLLTVKTDVDGGCRNGIRLDPTDKRPCE